MNNFFYGIFRIFPRIQMISYRYWNRLFFSLIGIKYGRRMKVYNKVYVIGRGYISIGNDFLFTSGAGINPLCRNIRGTLCAIRGAKIEIGDRVGISSSCLWAREYIRIGNDVNIGGDCLILDSDIHPYDHILRCRVSNNDSRGGDEMIPVAPIQIDDDVWIGARCIILKGVHIGARSIIGAGSVVTRDIPADSVAVGNPCKVIRKTVQL